MTDNKAAILSRIDAATGEDLFFALRILADYYKEYGGSNATLADGLRWLAAVCCQAVSKLASHQAIARFTLTLTKAAYSSNQQVD